MMSKKQLLLLLPALFAAISTLPANAAHILTGGGTGAANASGTGISMQLNQGFTSDTALPGAVNLDSIQLKLTDNRFTVDFTSGSLTMVVFTKPASDSADWTVVGQSRTEENLSVNIDSYTDVEFTFSNLLLNTSQEYVFAFVSDAAMLGRLTIGTSLQAEEGADSPFSVDNGFAYASMQSTAFYSGAPVILYYNTGNETSMYFPNMIPRKRPRTGFMPACHAVVRGPARLTQKKITSNRQTTGISGTATAFCDFPNCLSRGGKSRTGSLGIPPIPQRRLRAFTWQSWMPQPSSAPRPPLHRAANRYGTSAPGVPYHVGAAYVFIHSRGIQARLKKQDFFLSRTSTRHTSREEPWPDLS